MLKAALTAVFLLASAPLLAANSPAQLINNAVEIFKQTDAVRYNVIASNAEDLRVAGIILRGSVIANLDAEDGVVGARVDVKVSGDDIPRSTRYVLIANEEGAQFLNYGAKTETRLTLDEIAETDANIAGALVMWINFFTESSNGAYFDDGSAELAGTERVGRDLCDIISSTQGDSPLKMYISQSSGLPARMDTTQPNGEPLVLRFTNMRTNIKAVPSNFEIKPAPRGFTTAGAGPDAPSAPATAKTDATEGSEVGDLAPGWTLFDSKSKRHSLDDYEGELVLLDFWATWCGPCKRAMPGLQRMHKEYASEGLNVIGVNVSEQDPNDAVKYMRSHSFTYQLLLNGDPLKTPYDVTGFPTFVLIDRDGTIIHRGRGFSVQGERELENIIREALDMPARSFDIDSMDDDNIDNWDG